MGSEQKVLRIEKEVTYDAGARYSSPPQRRCSILAKRASNQQSATSLTLIAGGLE